MPCHLFKARDPRHKYLLAYYERTWLQSTVWSPRNISVYHRLVRTNNDSEGYHRRLNGICREDHPPFYKLREILYNEVKLISRTAKLVSNQSVKMHRSRQTDELQSKIGSVWDDYDEEKIDEKQMVQQISRFMGFRVTKK